MNHHGYHHSPLWVAGSTVIAVAVTGLAVLAWQSQPLEDRRSSLWADLSAAASPERLIIPELSADVAGQTFGDDMAAGAGETLSGYQPAPPPKPATKRRR